MKKKSIAKRCLDLWGEENQIYQMIEESSELLAALCHQRRGRYTPDHVREEIADCFNVLDQMDLVFGKTQSGFVTPDSDKNNMTSLNLIAITGELQLTLAKYILSIENRSEEKIRDLFNSFRQHLDYLTLINDSVSIEKWKYLKRERILRKIELGEAKKLQ